MKNIPTRCFIKAEDIMTLRKIKKRQAQSDFAKIKKSFEKKGKQLVTLEDCAAFYDVPYEKVEEAVLFNDLPDEEDDD